MSNTYAELQRRIDELEVKVAFQDDTLDVLQKALSEQTLVNLDLQRQVLAMREAWSKFAARADHNSAGYGEEIPPHY
jgi:uncharacterized coiled-coil protein SlyX